MSDRPGSHPRWRSHPGHDERFGECFGLDRRRPNDQAYGQFFVANLVTINGLISKITVIFTQHCGSYAGPAYTGSFAYGPN